MLYLSWLSEPSFQNFICLWTYLDAFNHVPLQFPKLCGMTGTAATESTEFESIYKLKVTIVPTNKPMIRKVSSCLSFMCNTLINWWLFCHVESVFQLLNGRNGNIFFIYYIYMCNVYVNYFGSVRGRASGFFPFTVKFGSLTVNLSRFIFYII